MGRQKRKKEKKDDKTKRVNAQLKLARRESWAPPARVNRKRIGHHLIGYVNVVASSVRNNTVPIHPGIIDDPFDTDFMMEVQAAESASNVNQCQMHLNASKAPVAPPPATTVVPAPAIVDPSNDEELAADVHSAESMMEELEKSDIVMQDSSENPDNDPVVAIHPVRALPLLKNSHSRFHSDVDHQLPKFRPPRRRSQHNSTDEESFIENALEKQRLELEQNKEEEALDIVPFDVSDSKPSISFIRKLIARLGLDQIENVWVLSSGIGDERAWVVNGITDEFEWLRSLFSATNASVRTRYGNIQHQWLACMSGSRADALKSLHGKSASRPFRLSCTRTAYSPSALKMLTVRLNRNEIFAQRTVSIISQEFSNIEMYKTDKGKDNCRGYINFFLHDGEANSITENIHDSLSPDVYGSYPEYEVWRPGTPFYEKQPPQGIKAMGGLEKMFSLCLGKFQIIEKLKDKKDWNKLPLNIRNIIESI